MAVCNAFWSGRRHKLWGEHLIMTLALTVASSFANPEPTWQVNMPITMSTSKTNEVTSNALPLSLTTALECEWQDLWEMAHPLWWKNRPMPGPSQNSTLGQSFKQCHVDTMYIRGHCIAYLYMCNKNICLYMSLTFSWVKKLVHMTCLLTKDYSLDIFFLLVIPKKERMEKGVLVISSIF